MEPFTFLPITKLIRDALRLHHQAMPVEGQDEFVALVEAAVIDAEQKGSEEGYQTGYDAGYTQGKDDGQEHGYTEGYDVGYNANGGADRDFQEEDE